MIVRELSADEYTTLFPRPPHVFNSTAFTELNRHKCDSVHYLAFSDSRLRGGLITGKRYGEVYAPFSAPYGGFTLTKQQPVEVFSDMLSALKTHFSASHGRICITLPPLWHDPNSLSKSINALSRIEGAICVPDLSYHLNLLPGSGLPLEEMTVTGRQNMRRALNMPYEFLHTDGSPEAIAEVYDIIKQNHDHKGYTLRMTLADMQATARVLPADFFLLRIEGKPIAAAQVYRVAPGIAQLINWGDIRTSAPACAMTRLAHELAQYYATENIRVLDLGPATEDGIPNEGLCRFKESLGGVPSLKYRFTL